MRGCSTTGIEGNSAGQMFFSLGPAWPLSGQSMAVEVPMREGDDSR